MTLPPDDGAVAVFDAGARLIRLAPGFAALSAPGASLAEVMAALGGDASGAPAFAIARAPGGGFRLDFAPPRENGAERRESMLRLLVELQRAAASGADAVAALTEGLERLMRLCDCRAGMVAELRRHASGRTEPALIAARGAWAATPPVTPPVLLRALEALAPLAAEAGPETLELGHTAILPVVERGRPVGVVALSGRAEPFDDDLMACISATPAIVALLLSLRTHRQRRAKAALRLRASHDQVRAIFDTIREGVVIASADGGIIGFNAAAERMFGCTLETVLGRPFADRIADAATPEQLHAESDGRRREILARKCDGQTFPAEVSVSRIAVEGGPLHIAIFQDITERKRVARVQSELIASVGHDLRTPLTAILGALRLVNGGGLAADKSREMLDIAERNGRRLMRLITDLLDLERINAGMIAFLPAPYDLTAVLRQCVENQRPLTEAKGLRIAWALPEEPLEIVGDADRLAQVVTNILANAVQFSPKDGAIAIRAFAGGDSVRVEVSDQGPGIPADFLPVMFDRFRQVSPGARRDGGEGSGLGLSIVRALVELHGGRVGAVSPPGAGATVYFELPRKTLRKS